jgi:hypothetical protein
MRHRFTAPFFAVLVLALAAFAGSALAGDGHSKGSGDTAKAAKPAPAQPVSPDKPAKQDKQSSTSASNPATGGDNSQGVKPSNTTKHDTYAKASSDQTKKYGNGQTAGQIATKSGHGDATLHGPGNSQPHKTAACPGGHEVDVHALKNKDSKCATTSSEQKKTKSETKTEKSSLMVSFCDMETATTGKLETKSADKILSHELNGTPEEARDIVPLFTLNGQSYSQLWDANGQAIFAAGCGEAVHVKAAEHVEKSSLKVSFCDMETATTGKLETKSADKVLKHELNGTPEEARDIVPTFTLNGTTYSQLFDANGQAIFAAGCNAPAAPATAAPATAAPATAAPATAAPATVAPATVAPATVAPATTAAGAVQGTQATITPAASSPAATPAAAGGVKGAVVALKPTKTKPAGGVLGATTRLGGKVASTTLPFTGLPLWIFALVAAGLIGIGLTVRRASANRI